MSPAPIYSLLNSRLEREENERIAERKRLEAAQLKDQLIASSRRSDLSGGLRFKGKFLHFTELPHPSEYTPQGRGLMKYRDPEIDRRHSGKY